MTGVALPKGVVGPAVLLLMHSPEPSKAVSLALEVGELALIVEGARRLLVDALTSPLADREQRQAAGAAEAVLAPAVARIELLREVLVGDAAVEVLVNGRNTVRRGTAHVSRGDVLLPVAAGGAANLDGKKRRR